MIGRITGILAEKTPEQVLIDVQGVAYEIDISSHSYQALPQLHQQVVIYIHTLIREDAHTLYGFIDVHESAMFRQLIKVNGVGPRLALAILSGMQWHTLVTCIGNRDTHLLTRIAGVGKKTAERLVIELQDKLPAMGDADTITPLSDQGVEVPDAVTEAHSALVHLGYKAAQADEAIRRVRQAAEAQDLGSKELIRRALKTML